MLLQAQGESFSICIQCTVAATFYSNTMNFNLILS